MTDRYAVIGHPIAHSKSPAIHAAFAAQTAQDLSYEALLAPLDGFAAAVAQFRAQGGRGMNITVPFKEEAWQLADRLTERARLAGAVNTFVFGGDVQGDNTDGAGLVRDLEVLGAPLAGARVLLLGAGGAARGVILPLIDAGVARLFIANRTADKARALQAHFAGHDARGVLAAGGWQEAADAPYDVVINATSASLSDEAPPLPAGLYAPDSLAYDMVYGRGLTAYLKQARDQGAARLADGLGMLVEQAAEAFALWRGVHPDTAAVRATLRAALPPLV
ncbi:Shikimate dehydrogenase [Methyloversatilis universalis FAM5]|uniref:Shikimate dehydrogenase (NADP(+)) n=1 Tax=Methyloversatilis universalis (strain ATCC BAA-1314 / DSM 25237 / JCM 13912 / CCUG 52030 / FAM5) TaxID=1000565 RepID=F5RF77_METUF|nr:shikimate dehydrogenase [Methyloversatilis universalis]EGK70733.1 Shikimate dehydrogenase [Methyloversatilis universalis FAM5]